MLGKDKNLKKNKKTIKKCPKCGSEDLIVIPGSPIFYCCRNKNCPSLNKKGPYDNDKEAGSSDSDNRRRQSPAPSLLDK